MRWTHAHTPSPVLHLEECTRRGGRIYARWWRRHPGRGSWVRRSLGIGIRAADGTIDRDLERQVLQLGADLHRALRAGQDPRVIPLSERPPSLEEGLGLYLTVGQAFATETRHLRDLRHKSRRLVRILGPATTWTALAPTAGRDVWRALAHESRDGRGLRAAEQTVALLHAAGAWLREAGHLRSETGPQLPSRWRQRMGREWGQITGRDPEIRRPRYTLDEARRLWAHLALADPRLRLALTLAGPEHRLGQVWRVRRSDLDLSVSAAPHGRVRIPGQGTKVGGWIHLTSQARALLDAELAAGYLAERACEDYALFPSATRTPDGLRLHPDPDRCISDSVARRLLRELEDLAGVPHVEGRGWHGLRRLAADLALAESERPDARTLLDRLGSWRSRSVREESYLSVDSPVLVAETEALRARVRAAVGALGGPELDTAGGADEGEQSSAPRPENETHGVRRRLRAI